MQVFTTTDIALVILVWSAYVLGGIYMFAWKPKQRALRLTRQRTAMLSPNTKS